MSERSVESRPVSSRAQAAIAWETDISLFRNATFLRQLGLALGIPVLLLFLFLLALEWPVEPDFWPTIAQVLLLVAGILVVLLLITIGMVYGGRYEYQYSLDAEGIQGRPRGGTAKKNTVVNWLLMLSGRPSAMGAGMLAASRQVEHVQWRDVSSVTADPHGRTIVLRGKRRPLMVVFCDDSHYEDVLRLSREAVMQAHAASQQTILVG